MHETMTDEELREYGERFDPDDESQEAEDARRALAHIAALTAERDAARREREQFRDDLVRASEFAHQGGTGSPVTQEGRDAIESIGALWNKAGALRERVKALEVKQQATTGQGAMWMQRAQDAASRLAAIRQRAENIQRPGVAASVSGTTTGAAQDVARYILGDDAPAPLPAARTEALHCCGTTTDIHREDCPTVEALRPLGMAPPSEPTTVEAFARVREAVTIAADNVSTPTGENAMASATSALSLLERRMGALHGLRRALLEVALPMLLADVVRLDRPGEMTWSPAGARAVLAAYDACGDGADAPPVFTLKEVDASMSKAGVSADERMEIRAHLTSLRK